MLFADPIINLCILLGVLVLVFIAVAIVLLVKYFRRRSRECSSETATETTDPSDAGASDGASELYQKQNGNAGNCNGSNGTCKPHVLIAQLSQKHEVEEAATDKTSAGGALAVQIEPQSARPVQNCF